MVCTIVDCDRVHDTPTKTGDPLIIRTASVLDLDVTDKVDPESNRVEDPVGVPIRSCSAYQRFSATETADDTIPRVKAPV